jgi:hypothetical protein
MFELGETQLKAEELDKIRRALRAEAERFQAISAAMDNHHFEIAVAQLVVRAPQVGEGTRND